MTFIIYVAFGFAACATTAITPRSELQANRDSKHVDIPAFASRLSVESNEDLDHASILQRYVDDLQIERPTEYEGGVYGKVGSATMFIADKKSIPDFDRLYWVMVKVLSEKYGCFMKKKQSSARVVSVRCRDKRIIVFKRFLGDDWIQFYGRQYDLAGNELIVRR